jgi:hypothetical protein
VDTAPRRENALIRENPGRPSDQPDPRRSDALFMLKRKAKML